MCVGEENKDGRYEGVAARNFGEKWRENDEPPFLLSHLAWGSLFIGGFKKNFNFFLTF